MIRALRKLTALLLTLAMTFALLPTGLTARAESGKLIKKNLRLLAVGNSFSVDGLQHLYKIAESAGYQMEIGILHINACSLEEHLRNLEEGKREYVYYQFTPATNGSQSNTVKRSVADALLDKQWDVITLQQASKFSGVPDSYRTFAWRCRVGSGQKSVEAAPLMAVSQSTAPTELTDEADRSVTERGGDSSAEPEAPEEVPAEEREDRPEEPETGEESGSSAPGETPQEESDAQPAEPEEDASEETPEDESAAEQPEEPLPEEPTSGPEEQEEYAVPTYSQEESAERKSQSIVCDVDRSGTGSTIDLNASAKTGLTYRSDRPEVAEVDRQGKVTLHRGGEAVVTVTAAESQTYQAAETQVTITNEETSYMAQLKEALRQLYADGTEHQEGWGQKAADKVKFGWQVTWAYAGQNVHPGFLDGYANYNYSQSTMYQDIMDTAQQVVLPSKLFDFYVPTGTAIQNARSSYVGDRLNRDGIHLTKGLGRYIAAMTWASALGIDIDKVTYLPAGSNGVIEGELPMIRESVTNAMNRPFAQTKSKYTKTPRLAKPLPNVPVNVDKGIQVNWPQVDGAAGYRLYRKNGSSYKLLRSFAKDDKDQIVDRQKNKDGTERLFYACTDTAAKNNAGTTYTYYVSAWYQFGAKEYVGGSKDATAVSGDLVETASAKVKQTRLLAPAKVTAKNTAKGIKVSWTKVGKAVSYRLYRTKSGGKRTSLVTVKSGVLSYNDVGAQSKNGVSYTYEVVPCTKLGEGVPSAGKSVTRLTAVTLKRLNQVGSGGIRLKWSRNKKATGYSIYRKVNGGSWSKVKTIGKNATVTYTDKTAKSGKTYAYRIYAYKGSSSSPVSNSLKLKLTK
jgi:hypothetical protein